MPEPTGTSQPARRPRGVCPQCGRDVALTVKTRLIGHHYGKVGPHCPGIGQPPSDTPSPADLLARLVEVTANLNAFIERRARELAVLRSAKAPRNGRKDEA
jgi:hypothetical protein